MDIDARRRARLSTIRRTLLATALLLAAACGDASSSGAAPEPSESDARSSTSSTPSLPDPTHRDTSVPVEPPGASAAPPTAPAPPSTSALPSSDGPTETPTSSEQPPTSASAPGGCPPPPLDEAFGDEIAPGAWRAHTMPQCLTPAHRMVVAAGVRWRIDVRELPSDARLVIHGPHWRSRDEGGSGEAPLAEGEPAGEDGSAHVVFTSEHAGEHTMLIERGDTTTQRTYALRVSCEDGCDLRATRYPIALLHGYAGVDSYFGVVDYFWDVPTTLGRRGFDVRTPVSTPIATSQRRAGELEPQLEAILEETGARRINLIAHSQGGLDGRVLISAMGWHDRVASLTTIATPHRGIGLVLADFVSVQDFSVEYMEETFNPEHPDHPDVAYFSWSARACRLSQRRCRDETNGALVDALLITPHLALTNAMGDNDGIVPTASMPWGDHLGQLHADHFGEVGHLFKRNNPDAPFVHRAFYLSEAERLREAGF